jgi:hypothetical protein
MGMIFPGMDPYLEEPILWHSFHQSMIVYLAEALQPMLLPRYVASVDERVFVEGPDDRTIYPDVAVKVRPEATPSAAATVLLESDTAVEVDVYELEIHESLINILDLKSGQQIVTVIELVSPTNKYAGTGRTSYLRKQREVLGSQSHLVEIDLLRAGPYVLAIPESIPRSRGRFDSLISVNLAAPPRKRFRFYARILRQRLPVIRIPLRDNDPDVRLDLQAVLARTYEAGAFQYFTRYDEPCRPPLSAEDQAWADELIRAAAAQSSPQPSS